VFLLNCFFSNKRQPKILTGFSLIEVLFVVVILGILVACAIARFSRGSLFDRLNVYTIAHQIAADTRLARRLAITTGKQHRIRFVDTGGVSLDLDIYYIEVNNSGTWIALGGFPKKIPAGVSVRSSQSADYDAVFNIDGSSDETQYFNCIAGNYQYRIHILQATGRVSFYSY